MSGGTCDFVELFCGIGGFRLGLEKANKRLAIGTTPQQRTGDFQRGCDAFPQNSPSPFTCVWANDNDRSACRIYHYRFGYKELVEADIKTVNVNSIPDHTLLTAGFPCQAFSVAGKRKGFRDTRGTLFHEICRIAKAKQPPLLLLENVKGLLSHDEGLTFQIILESLEELGYLCEWQVLNSKHFGVPQNRERVFIIGHLRGTGERTVFPIGQDGGKTNQDRSVVRTLQGGGHSGGLHSNMTAISHSVRSGGRGSLDRHRWDTIKVVAHRKNYRRNTQVFDPRGLTEALDTSGGGGRQRHVVVPLGFLTRNQKNYNPDYMLCLDGQNTTGLTDGMRIRRLTPVECERLQGFPNGWTRGVSDTQRYKLLGNAVTVSVIEFLGRKLLEVSN